MASQPVTNGPISVSNKVSENDQKGLMNTQMNSNDVDTQIEFFSLHLSSVASVLALFIIIAALCCCWRCSKRKNWARILNWCCVKCCTISEEALQTSFELKVIDENQRTTSTADLSALDFANFIQVINDRTVAAAEAQQLGSTL